MACAWGGGFRFFEQSWGEVIIITDMTREGRALTPPTRENPAYYLGSSLGAKLGSIPGDRLPDVHAMNKVVAKLLERQGYVGAQPGVHEPSLYLVLQWGYLKPATGDLLWFLGYNADDDIAAPQSIGMLGPEVFRRNFRSHSIETILNTAADEIYGVIITAFEYKSASTKKPVILWQTRIGLPANGKSMAEAIPVMVQMGAAQVGRETTKPVLRDVDDRYTTKLGELEVIGFEDEQETKAGTKRQTGSGTEAAPPRK